MLLLTRHAKKRKRCCYWPDTQKIYGDLNARNQRNAFEMEGAWTHGTQPFTFHMGQSGHLTSPPQFFFKCREKIKLVWSRIAFHNILKHKSWCANILHCTHSFSSSFFPSFLCLMSSTKENFLPLPHLCLSSFLFFITLIHPNRWLLLTNNYLAITDMCVLWISYT